MSDNDDGEADHQMRSPVPRMDVARAVAMVLFLFAGGTGRAGGVTVTVPDTTIRTGAILELPVEVDQVDGLDIISYQFTLQYDPEIVEAAGVFSDGGLAAQWGDPTVNLTLPGEMTVVHYGVDPLSGEGCLIKLRFQVTGNPGEISQLRFASFFFNEGLPSVSLADPAARVTVAFEGVPVLSVFPETLNYGESDTVRILTVLNVGADTLSWSISEVEAIPWLTRITPASGQGDEVIAVYISRAGLSLGSYSGVLVVSSNGGHREVWVTLTVPQEQFVVDVSIPDTSQYKSRRVQLPLRVGEVTNMGIIAYEFTLLFDKSVVNIVGASTDSTLSEAWGEPSLNTETAGQVSVSHVGSTPLAGRGTLISVACIAVGNPGDTSQLTFERFVFNDGYPYARWDTPLSVFSVDTADVPLLFVSPTVLDFGSYANVKTFEIVNLGTDTLVWNVVEDPAQEWITSILPVGGFGEATVSVAVSRIALPAGLHTGNLSVASNGGQGRVTVSISVPSGERYLKLTLPDTTAMIREELSVPVTVTDLTAFGVMNYQFAFQFEEHVIEVIGAGSAGTLSSPWGTASVDLTTPGRVLVSHHGLLPLAGAGTLIALRLRAIGAPQDSTAMSFAEVRFNGNASVARFDSPAGIFVVKRPDYPLLSVSPTTLDFGSRLTTKTVTISNIGLGTLRWSIFESPVEVDWITDVSPPDGEGTGTVTVVVDRKNLLPDTYGGGLYVASNGGYENITVQMVVVETDTAPPYLAFSSPRPGDVEVARNGSIYLIIDDLDSDVKRSTASAVVSGDTIVAQGQDRSGGAVRFLPRELGLGLVYRPVQVFGEGDTVVVDIRAEDTAFPSHLYQGQFSYVTGAATVDLSAEAMVGPGGGTLSDPDGILITVPAGAFGDSLWLGLGPVNDPPSLPDTLVAVGTPYLFEPEGLDFCPLPGVGRLVYSDDDLEAAGLSDPAQLQVFGFNMAAGLWEAFQIMAVDPDARMVLFSFCRLGYFTLGAWRGTSIEGPDGPTDLPAYYRLHQNHPNPFNVSTHIPLDLPAGPGHCHVVVDIYNLLGERLRTVYSGHLSPGSHTLVWDGCAGSGRQVPSGVYICRMIVDDARGRRQSVQQRKMLCLK